jgi:hypothetical protein
MLSTCLIDNRAFVGAGSVIQVGTHGYAVRLIYGGKRLLSNHLPQ